METERNKEQLDAYDDMRIVENIVEEVRLDLEKILSCLNAGYGKLKTDSAERALSVLTENVSDAIDQLSEAVCLVRNQVE